ncbi:translation initiation factor IF-2 [Alligator mississippiensis]|uniref:translation initiation factor IF-2 n=1 Tax=Alligator mississippiensis TaxID=8496 RepID=UPI002877F947|nr:translation initiation factor IF-2 [Alligator mississippiensis]
MRRSKPRLGAPGRRSGCRPARLYAPFVPLLLRHAAWRAGAIRSAAELAASCRRVCLAAGAWLGPAREPGGCGAAGHVGQPRPQPQPAAGSRERREAPWFAAGTMPDPGEGSQAQGSAQARHRGPGWRHEEVIDLLAIWGQETTLRQFAQGQQRNEHIYRAIATQMAARGHSKTWQQCRTKAKGLRQEFYAARGASRRSRTQRFPMPYYQELARILGLTATKPPGYPVASRGGAEPVAAGPALRPESPGAGPSARPAAPLPPGHAGSNSEEGRAPQARPAAVASPEARPEPSVPQLPRDGDRSGEDLPAASRWSAEASPPSEVTSGSSSPQPPGDQDPPSPGRGDGLSPRPDTPSARGEPAAQSRGAARPLSRTPGAIRMRRLRREQDARRDRIQEELLRAERARLREAQAFRQQVLAELRHFRRDQALAQEEAQAGRVALQQLVAEIRQEQQLAQDSYEELRQLRASINTAVQEERRVSQQLLAAIPAPAAPAAAPQPAPAPAPVQAPAPAPAGPGPVWEHFAWLVAQLAPQQAPRARRSRRGAPLLPSPSRSWA